MTFIINLFLIFLILNLFLIGLIFKYLYVWLCIFFIVIISPVDRSNRLIKSLFINYLFEFSLVNNYIHRKTWSCGWIVDKSCYSL